MKLKNKLILSAIVALIGIPLFSVSGINANASSKYMARTVRLHRFYPSRTYSQAFSRRTYRINKGSHIYERIHWHLGHDGYDIHVYGKSGWYYGPWWHHYGYYFNNGIHHHINKLGHFKRTNNKRLLKQSGFKSDYPLIVSDYSPYSIHAYIPKRYKITKKTEWIPNSPNIAYDYIGHGHWKYINYNKMS